MKMYSNKSIQHSDKTKKFKRKNKNQRAQSDEVTTDIIDYARLRLKVNLSGSVMPMNFRSTFRFYGQVNFTAVTTPQVYVYRANSPYDPDQTGTGLQPVGWDNFLTFYESSFCIGSLIKVSIVNNTTVPLQIALVPTFQSSTLSSYDNGRIMPKRKLLMVDGTSRGGHSFGVVTNSQSTLAFYGGDFDRDYMATGQASAGKQFYWSLAFQTYDQATAISCSLQVEIFYDILFVDRKLIALS